MLSNTQGSRALQYALVLVIAITLNFLLPRLMPGNPLALLAGVEVGLLTPEERANIITEVGLDRPLYMQYFSYWGDILRGDFGYSYRENRPITQMLFERLPWTLLLTGTSLAFSALIGVTAGAISAWRRAGALDIALLWSMISLNSIPSFWLGMLLISVISVRYGALPSFGAETPASDYVGWARVVDIIRHTILPVLTLSVISVPGIYLVMRYTMLGVLGEDFIRTARSKGVSETRILFGHIAPNALAPVVTILTLRLGFAFGGTVVIETVFSYPGLGRLIFEAVSGRDYPVMQAAFLLITVSVLLSNLLADFLYPLLDPRTKAS